MSHTQGSKSFWRSGRSRWGLPPSVQGRAEHASHAAGVASEGLSRGLSCEHPLSYLSAVDFSDLKFHEDTEIFHLSDFKRTFWLARDLAVSQPLVISEYGKESVVSCSGPVTLFSTKGFPPTAKSPISLPQLLCS